jgi:hypothetical protein
MDESFRRERKRIEIGNLKMRPSKGKNPITAAARVLGTAAGFAMLPGLVLGRPIRMSYGFKAGRILKYVIERQDSVWCPEARGSFLRIGRRLSVPGADGRGFFSVVLSADSLWTEPDDGGPDDGIEKMLLGTEIRSPETVLHLDASGRDASGAEASGKDADGAGPSVRSRFCPFLVPLAPEPVEPDDAWNFSVRVPHEEPFKGGLTVSGEVLFYETTEDPDGGTTAVLSLRLERRNRAELTVREPFQTFTNRYDTAETGSGVLFFNVDRGCVVKGVIQWSGTGSAVENGRPDTYRKKSRISFRLEDGSS